MRNYQTEEGTTINFLSEIDNIDLNDDDNMCLISNQPLDDTHVLLKCGHKFNYHSIYNDIIHVKGNQRMMTRGLEIDQIQCPYCRQIHRGLLPYIPKLRLPKKDGVNWINVKKHFTHRVYSRMGDCSVASCDKNVFTIWDDENVTQPHCFFHYKRKCPKSPKKKQLNVVIETNDNVQTSSLNEVLSLSNDIVGTQSAIQLVELPTIQGCPVLLKSGSRKGKACGAKAKVNGCCLRHQPH